MLELYGSLGIVAGIAQAIYVAMAFGLGGMLVARGVRRSEWAQRTLGAHLLLSLGAGYVPLSAGVASVELGAELDPVLLAQGNFLRIMRKEGVSLDPDFAYPETRFIQRAPLTHPD